MEFRNVIRACASDRAVLVSTHDGAATDFAVGGTTEAVEEAFRRMVQP